MIQVSTIHTGAHTMGKVATRYDVSDCATAEALLDKTGLNWEPEVLAAGFMTNSGNLDVATSPKFRAIVNPRTREALAFATTRFKPNSHVKAVHDMWGLVQHGSATPHGVSVWDGGARIALQFRCPDLDVAIGPRSIVSPLLTLVVNHDAAGSDRGFFADFDYWCKNQAGIVAKVQGAGVRHASGVITNYESLLESRIRSMRDGMGDRYNTMKRMADGTARLGGMALLSYFGTALDLPADSIKEAVDVARAPESKLTTTGKVLRDVMADYRADDHGVPGTVWHAYSAITRYTSHTEGRNEATRMQRALLGSQDRYVRAFTEAARLVTA